METLPKPIRIAMADDHILLRTALANLIDSFGEFKVMIQARNGKELIDKLQPAVLPEIVLLDLNMPVMDGFETAAWFRQNYPEVPIIMLTMYDAEATMIRLLRNGVRGFIKKDVHPAELRLALQSLAQYGYYYSHDTTGKLVNLFRHQGEMALQKNVLTDIEIKFLELAASDKTYKEVALELELSPRAVDNLRDHLFSKLEVKSRVGLALYAIKQGLVKF
ncbi:MAG: response regulator [Chitinophagaceae bacterium]